MGTLAVFSIQAGLLVLIWAFIGLTVFLGYELYKDIRGR